MKTEEKPQNVSSLGHSTSQCTTLISRSSFSVLLGELLESIVKNLTSKTVFNKYAGYAQIGDFVNVSHLIIEEQHPILGDAS